MGQEILEIIKETSEKWGIRSYDEERQDLEERREQEKDFLKWKKEKLQRIYINEIEEEDKKREREKKEREWNKQRKELRRWEEKQEQERRAWKKERKREKEEKIMFQCLEIGRLFDFRHGNGRHRDVGVKVLRKKSTERIIYIP